MYKKISTPFADAEVKGLVAGDRILLSGVIYAARDAAHRKLHEAIQNGEELPFNLKNQVIYYAGPCPARPGMVAGPFGPTTSGRMDKYTPELIRLGLKGMIGKGDRAPEVVSAMKSEGAVYFAAIGGIGAYIAATIETQEVIAYGELGAEAIHKLTVKDLPLIVAIDSNGNNLYQMEPPKYKDKYTAMIKG